MAALSLPCLPLSFLLPWQTDYLLGKNPLNMSYVIGVGSSSPLQMHHRGASVVSYRTSSTAIGCGESWTWFQKSTPNPNVHHGALIGGPMDGVRHVSPLQLWSCVAY